MDKTAQATLSAPITVQGKKTDILTLRRATLGDDEDAMDMASSFFFGFVGRRELCAARIAPMSSSSSVRSTS